MLLAPGLRPGILLAIQQHAGRPRDKETPALNAASVEGETLASVSRESSQARVCRNHETTTLREQESWGGRYLKILHEKYHSAPGTGDITRCLSRF